MRLTGVNLIRRLFLAGLLISIIFGNSNGQFNGMITGVDFRMENNRIVVSYAIENYLPQQVFTIRLTFVTEDNKVIVPLNVSGDIGPGISGGPGKTIFWDFEKEFTQFSGTLKAVVSVIVPVAKYPDNTSRSGKPERGTGGPGYAAYSMLFPGLGGYFVEKNTSRAIAYNVLAAAVLTSFIVHTVKLDDLEVKYDAASSTQKPAIQDEIDKTLETIDLAMGAYLVLWTTDIVWVLYKGSKNLKERKLQGGFTLNYNGSRFLAGYKVNF